jgi:glycosyltransferase involved in cell wall biosynthesis
MKASGKRIAILSKLPPPYMGTSIWSEILLRSNLREHFNLHHIDTKVTESLQAISEVGLLKSIQYARLYSRVHKILSKVEPDLTLIPFSQSTIGFLKDSILVLIASVHSKKIIFQLHGSNFKNWVNSSSAITRRYVRFILTKGAGVIVLGNKLKYLFKDFFSDELVFAIPNGADYDFPLRVENQEKMTLMYLGNLQPSKGIEDIVDALSLLDGRAKKKVILKVVGAWRDNETRLACLQNVKSSSLPVVFIQPLYGLDKLQQLINADIFLFTPRAPEGHPWVIVEAMAAGLPIISTDQGAIAESVIDGVNGFIVEKRNPQQIAERLKILIEDPELRRKMGRESRRLYEENFTEEKMVVRLAAVFDKVLSE